MQKCSNYFWYMTERSLLGLVGNTSPATKGLSAGAIAAIVLSVALVTAILVWLLMFQFFRRHGKPIITSSRITCNIPICSTLL
jgi:hypothetical protein